EVLPWASQRLRRRFLLRRQFMARYQELQKEAPEKIAALEARIHRFDERLAKLGLGPEDLLASDEARPTSIAKGALTAILRLLALPLVLVGIATHYAVYRLIGFLSRRL